MQHSFKVIEGDPAAALPILATADDVREVVQFLKKKPEGITIIEASDAIRKRLFDPRKVAAYELWGIVSRNGDRMKLSQLGWEFAGKLEPEAQIYRVMLDNTPPYRAVLEWIHEQDFELVTYADIVDYWTDNFPDALQRDERTCEGHVVSFLHLCQAGEIGMATVGRKGQPSRLRVDREELTKHVYARAHQVSALHGDGQLDSRRLAVVGSASPQRRRLFISISQGLEIVDSIQDVLGIADIESEVVERNTGGNTLMSERLLQAMRRCDAGIIIVSLADCQHDAAGKAVINQSALIEIGAAFVHFARRLVLLHEQQVPLPFNLHDFCHYEFQGSKLTWETGLRLVKTVKRFRADFQSVDAHRELPSND